MAEKSMGWHTPANKPLTFDEFKSEVCKLVRSDFVRSRQYDREICVDMITQQAYDKYCQGKITLIEMANEVRFDCDYWNGEGIFKPKQ